MKKIYHPFTLTIGLLSLVLLANCTEELPVGVQLSLVRHRLQMTTNSVAFGYNTDLIKTINVVGENTPWKLTGLPDWLSASATSGNGSATITLTAKENTSVDVARAATLTFASTAEDFQYSKPITVSQPVASIYITPHEKSLSFLPKGEAKTITIDSNVEWTATCSDAWVTLSKIDTKQLRVTVTENLSATRTATIHLKRSGTSGATINTIPVTQAEAGVTGSTDNIPFAVDGETKTTTITAEASWTADVSASSWISVTPTNGNAGDAKLTITTTANASANARSGFVYVRIGSAKKLAIPLSQEGVKFNVSSSTLTLKSTTESSTVNVTANTSWQVVSKPDWIEVQLPETLVGTHPLAITPQENPNTTTRTGKLVIGREGFSGNQTITITQEGKYFGNLATQMEFPITAATQSLTIETDGVWAASTHDAWIHLSPSSGQGNDQLQVSVDANPGKDERSGTIEVTVGQTTQTIAIVQAGRYIRLSCDNVITTSTPITVQLSVESNIEWTASSNVDWLSVELSQGEGDAALIVSVADNPSISERTGIITVQSDDVIQEFSFTQPGRTLGLSISTSTPLTFPASGGTSDIITVTTDGTYKITSSEDWLTIQEDGNTFTINVSRSNTTNKRTGTITIGLTDLANEEKLEHVITVEQNSLSLTVNPTSITFSYEGGTSDVIIVTTDGEYTVSPSATWLTIKKSGQTFTATATKNDGAKRETTIIVALTGLKSGENLTKTVTVIQKADEDPLWLCPNNNHPHAIDMGLTVNGKKVKFACCNVGSESQTNPQVQYGDRFAWGETTTKSSYTWSNYKWCNGSEQTLTKYCNWSEYGYRGFTDYKTTLEAADDAATVNWGTNYGGKWRTPTVDELSALNSTSNCTWEWTTIGGQTGFIVTSKTTQNNIFLPTYDSVTAYSYWSSKNESTSYLAKTLAIGNNRHFMNGCQRSWGSWVRPVTE